MNTNSNGFPQVQGGQQQFFTPAMLQALQSQQNPQFQKNVNNPALMNPQMFQQQQGLAMNPQQLLNGRGMSGMSQQQLGQSLNPAMLLQMQGGNAMQANIGEGMNGVNQAALNMAAGMGNNMANANMAGMGGMNANAMGFNPQQLAQLQQMTPQQIEARQMQAKLSVSFVLSDGSAGTDPFFPSFPPSSFPIASNSAHCSRDKWDKWPRDNNLNLTNDNKGSNRCNSGSSRISLSSMRVKQTAYKAFLLNSKACTTRQTFSRGPRPRPPPHIRTSFLDNLPKLSSFPSRIRSST